MSQEKQLIENMLKIIAARKCTEPDAGTLIGIINLVLGASLCDRELELLQYLKPLAEKLLKECKHIKGQQEKYNEQ